jgi:hypothetical protein
MSVVAEIKLPKTAKRKRKVIEKQASRDTLIRVTCKGDKRITGKMTSMGYTPSLGTFSLRLASGTDKPYHVKVPEISRLEVLSS